MLSGILLAGGKSLRMGRNKAFLKFRGKELYHYPLAVLEELCDDIVFSAPEDLFPKEQPYRIVPDIYPSKGPLSGIHSCLKQVRHEKAVVLSCDIPFITKGFITAMETLMGDAKVIAGTGIDGRPEPLAGIYSANLWPYIETLLLEDKLKMADFLTRSEAKLVDVTSIGFDPRQLFFNVNDQSDFNLLHDLNPPIG